MITGHFTEADFNALAFSFQSGRLVGIEIQYDVSESSQSPFDALLARNNKLYGTDSQIENASEKKAEITEKRRVFQWDKGTCSVRLIDFLATKQSDTYHKISLEYQNRGLSSALRLEDASRGTK